MDAVKDCPECQNRRTVLSKDGSIPCPDCCPDALKQYEAEKERRKIEVATKLEEGFDEDYQYNKVRISEYDDGALSFSDTQGGENWIYLYPDQVEALKHFLLDDKQTSSLERFKANVVIASDGDLKSEHHWMKANMSLGIDFTMRMEMLEQEMRKRGLI